MLGVPIGHDETLETELALENVVLQIRVLAHLRVVRLVVGAHDTTSASADSYARWSVYSPTARGNGLPSAKGHRYSS